MTQQSYWMQLLQRRTLTYDDGVDKKQLTQTQINSPDQIEQKRKRKKMKSESLFLAFVNIHFHFVILC